MKVVTVGGATQDVFIDYRDAETIELHSSGQVKVFLLLQEGAKIEVDAITHATGGGATNSAVSFVRQGFSVATLFACGNDDVGKFIIQSLEKEGIDLSNVRVIPEQKSAVSYVIPLPSGDRTIFAYRGANTKLTTQDISDDLFIDAKVVYITSLSGASSEILQQLCIRARNAGALVANNPGISQLAAGADMLREMLSHIDILILNSQEAQQFMASLVQTNKELQGISLQDCQLAVGSHAPSLLCEPIVYQNICFSLTRFFDSVLSRGPRVVVVTNGAEGVYVATKDVIYFHPSFSVTICNTIGAGDAFGSAFVGAIAQGSSIPDAMVMGALNSSSVISFLDAKKGLLSGQELEERRVAAGLGLVQVYHPPFSSVA